MRRAVLYLLILVFAAISSTSYAEEPRPFGLILGQTKKDEAIQILQKEGGRITESGYKIVKGDIINEDVEGIVFEELPLDNLTKATLWFYKGVLYRIDYQFSRKEEFDVVYRKLRAKYGEPTRVELFLDDEAVWEFKDVVIVLFHRDFDLYLTYIHIPLAEQVDISDEEALEKEINKPQKGL